MKHRAIIGVMGRGEDASQQDIALAEELGERIAREGWIVLTGGRSAGVMDAASRGAKRVPGSLTVGILPGDSRREASPSVDITIVTGLGSARNNINALSSDLVVSCGNGGAGTVSEIALAIKAGRPVILLSGSHALIELFGADHLIAVESAEEAVAEARQILSTARK